ncbi:MAG: NUDIX hydrolase [Terriglobia bacterium]
MPVTGVPSKPRTAMKPAATSQNANAGQHNGMPARSLEDGVRREFPNRPVLAVGGVVVKRGSVLLIRRGKSPSRGEWSLPGGMVEIGERVGAAVTREVREETSLTVEPVALAAVFERIVRQRGRIRFHYTVLDYACRVRGGRLHHATDVTDARWVRREELERYHLRRTARAVIRQAFEILEARPATHTRARTWKGIKDS